MHLMIIITATIALLLIMPVCHEGKRNSCFQIAYWSDTDPALHIYKGHGLVCSLFCNNQWNSKTHIKQWALLDTIYISSSRCKDYQSLIENILALTSKSMQYLWWKRKREGMRRYINLPRVREVVEYIKL